MGDDVGDGMPGRDVPGGDDRDRFDHGDEASGASGGGSGGGGDFITVTLNAILEPPPEHRPVMLLQRERDPESDPESGAEVDRVADRRGDRGADGDIDDRLVPVWIEPGSEWRLFPVRDRPRRPTAIDAIVDLVEASDGTIERAEIVGCHEGVFIAQLVLTGLTDPYAVIDLRVSDAVAVCLSAGAAILMARDVFESHALPAGSVFADGAAEAAGADSVDEFRRFLDDLDADDFLSGGDVADGPGSSGGDSAPGDSTPGDASAPGDDSAD